jgi:type IV secretory pathway TraG/TraD family ATPase VirD4
MYLPAIEHATYLWLLAAAVPVAFIARRYRRSAVALVERGARIEVHRRPIAGARSAWDSVTLAGVAVPASDECRHFKLLGATGTGKSSAIRELMAAAIRRGDRAVFADPDGSYLKTFHRRSAGDVILNPFEPGAAAWDFFGEADSEYATEQLVQALIPACPDASGQEWRGYARTFLSAVMCASMRRPCRNLNELWRLLTTASIEELRPLLANSPALPFTEAENVRMFASIRAVTSSALAPLEFVRRQRTHAFSVRQWINAPARTRLLFMPYKANQIAALRSIIAAWMRLAIFETLSGKEGHDQRLWFVVDELDALGAIDSLKDALVRLRKFGGRCVLGLQAASQIESTYGRDGWTLIENCSNTLVLRCSSSEQGGTSQFASKLIGDREVFRQQLSRGIDRDGTWLKAGSRRSRSVTRQLVTEPAVLAAEIEQLPDLCGYLKTASAQKWLKVKWVPHANLR